MTPVPESIVISGRSEIRPNTFVPVPPFTVSALKDFEVPSVVAKVGKVPKVIAGFTKIVIAILVLTLSESVAVTVS